MLRQAASTITWPLSLNTGFAIYWATPIRWLLNLFVPNSPLIYKANVIMVTTMKIAASVCCVLSEKDTVARPSLTFP